MSEILLNICGLAPAGAAAPKAAEAPKPKAAEAPKAAAVAPKVEAPKAAAAPAPTAAVSPKASEPTIPGSGERRVKMNRMRMKIAERLKESQDTAASLTTFNEVDMKYGFLFDLFFNYYYPF